MDLNTFFVIVGACTVTSWLMRIVDKLEGQG